jgi:segregation and condensation protein A
MATAEDSLLKHHDHAVRLPAFEGPLDLLLFLIRRHEIDIYDIPIETVLKQYLAVLRGIEKQQPEVAGEFFVMAATLMQIKSRMLLPPDRQPVVTEDEGDEDAALDPRWELVQQLLAYRRFKDAAHELERLVEMASQALPRHVLEDPADRAPRPLRQADRLELWNAFNAVLRRLAERLTVGEIDDEVVTVAECMNDILRRLRTSERFRFSELFADGRPRSQSHLISSFLAVLELTRLKHLALQQTENFGDIECLRVSPDLPAPGELSEESETPEPATPPSGTLSAPSE